MTNDHAELAVADFRHMLAVGGGIMVLAAGEGVLDLRPQQGQARLPPARGLHGAALQRVHGHQSCRDSARYAHRQAQHALELESHTVSHARAGQNMGKREPVACDHANLPKHTFISHGLVQGQPR